MQKNLFQGLDNDSFRIEVKQTAPSALTDYVVDELPYDLEAIRTTRATDGDVEELSEHYARLANHQEEILERLEHGILTNQSPEEAKKTQLDLLFMLGGYLPNGEEAYKRAPRNLLGLIEFNADRFGLPRRMDYDLIIDFNTKQYLEEGPIRTYLKDEEAKYERDFYVGHYFAEPSVRMAAYCIKSLVEAPGVTDAEALLGLAAEKMEEFAEYMRAYTKIPTDTFTILRQYLGAYPEGTRNASGAFLPSVQLLEALLHAPTETFQTYIDASMSYFPSWSQSLIANQVEASKAGKNLEQLLNNGDVILNDQAHSYLGKLMDAFISFRSSHIAITYSKIKEAFPAEKAISRTALASFGERPILDPTPEAAGTAGFNVQNVLGSATFRLFDLKMRIDETN